MAIHHLQSCVGKRCQSPRRFNWVSISGLVQKPILRSHATFLVATAIFLFAFTFRYFNFGNPQTLMVDEIYYVPAANSLLNSHVDPNYVHPPLGKLLIATGIAVFGYNSFGWRIAGVLAGSAIVPAAYLIGRKTFGEGTAITSSVLLVLDPLQHIMSRIAMLDIFLSLFVALAFLGVCYERFYLSAISLGLACGVKLSGAFAVVGVVAYLLCSGRLSKAVRVIPVIALTFLLTLIPVVVSSWSSFAGTFLFALNWHLTLASTHPSASSPLGWFVNIVPFPVYSDAGQAISASANPLIYPVSLPVAAFFAYDALRKRSCSLQTLPVFWLVFVYGLFFVLPRKTQFIFYLTPTVPAILLLFSYGVVRVLSYLSK